MSNRGRRQYYVKGRLKGGGVEHVGHYKTPANAQRAIAQVRLHRAGRYTKLWVVDRREAGQ